jgi:alkylation response protein AidB-like acyl-CoA dehydrogenase
MALTPVHAALPADLKAWLQQHAGALDDGSLDAAEVLPRLAAADVLRHGVPAAQGGLPDTDIGDAIETIAQLAELSVAGAFVAWSQRVFIEYLLRSPNAGLADAWLGPLLKGEQAGATALSNAMKFLSGIESLQIAAREADDAWALDGQMPWVTNLRPQGFLVAAAVAAPDGTPAVVALPHDIAGLERSADLPLLALQSTNTAALELRDVRIGPEWLIHSDARLYLPQARPAFAAGRAGPGLARHPGPAAASAGRAARCVDRGLDRRRA